MCIVKCPRKCSVEFCAIRTQDMFCISFNKQTRSALYQHLGLSNISFVLIATTGVFITTGSPVRGSAYWVDLHWTKQVNSSLCSSGGAQLSGFWVALYLLHSRLLQITFTVSERKAATSTATGQTNRPFQTGRLRPATSMPHLKHETTVLFEFRGVWETWNSHHGSIEWNFFSVPDVVHFVSSSNLNKIIREIKLNKTVFSCNRWTVYKSLHIIKKVTTLITTAIYLRSFCRSPYTAQGERGRDTCFMSVVHYIKLFAPAFADTGQDKQSTAGRGKSV